MTLGFSTNIDNKPTYFVEKIINSLHYDLKMGSKLNPFLLEKKYGYNSKTELIESIRELHPKKHTIRFMTPERADQWEDKKIHFVIGNRTPNRFQFAPLTKVTSIQRMHFRFNVGHIEIEIDEEVWAEIFHHGFDDIYEYTTDLEELAKNDGFVGVEDFIKYFNPHAIQDARKQGKYPFLIHWTDLKYE